MLDYLFYYLALNLWGALITWRFFVAAGIPAWKAFVPFYRSMLWFQVADRPKWWVIFAYVPIIDNVMSLILVYETLHMFGFKKLKHTLFTALTLGAYMGYLNYSHSLARGQRDNVDIRRRIPLVINHVFFAIVAAGSLRVMVIEAYNIPTSSMEKSLMVGDYLFVSKIHFGLRLPNTPWSIPLMHSSIPGTSTNSYSELIKLPYSRLPKLFAVKALDAVVFNVPVDPLRPVDKRDNYVKRCMGLPGDTIRIVDRQVYNDQRLMTLPDRSNGQFSYYVRTNGQGFNPGQIKRDFDINYLKNSQVNNQNVSDVLQITQTEFIVTIPDQALEAFSAMMHVDTVIIINALANHQFSEGTPEALIWYYNQAVKPMPMYPNPMGGHGDTTEYAWTRDNYGPLWLPSKGSTISLTRDHVLKYRRSIEIYEGHEFREVNGIYFIDDEPATSYTFEMDYYWMMGDNRHNSWDSRYWGPVPEDHVMGKPVFTFMSWDKYAKGMDKIRMDRLFTVVHGKGKPTSYLLVFLALVALYYGWEIWHKRKQSRQ
ncbi:MAG: signal peptidase I [Flavobacteriales bacterium]|jgi:signal peptidase I|tara:strand:+ start:9635 stop:11251 length:1617 start_codon:yes stop_codon:yes gene_type:complete